MATLVYIHGFLSSPLSYKALQVKEWLLEHRPDIYYCCPQLEPYPDECAHKLTSLIERSEKPVYLMGSSMGGFWATWCAERYGVKAVLINPAVDALNLLPAYLNTELKNYHNDKTYYLTKEHLQQLALYQCEHLKNLSYYWLLAQTGDETLDYRLAVEKYKGCRQTVEEGGDHSFQHFERFIGDAINFLEN